MAAGLRSSAAEESQEGAWCSAQPDFTKGRSVGEMKAEVPVSPAGWGPPTQLLKIQQENLGPTFRSVVDTPLLPAVHTHPWPHTHTHTVHSAAKSQY